jgi:predicted alpha/beta superfamily hydrolase
MMDRDLVALKSYRIRGVRDSVERLRIAGRTVDVLAPKGSQHLIVAHDGQNVFDRRTSTNGFTWRLAQQASDLFARHGLKPPTIIAIFHSSGELEPHGRALDLTPERPFREGIPVLSEVPQGLSIDQLRGDSYLDLIFEEVIPQILNRLQVAFPFERRAMLGSSMGGLATLYEIGREPDRYSTALAYSPHWILGGDLLVERMIESLPKPGTHRVWMSRGTRKLDREYESHQYLADRLMQRNGWTSRNFQSRVYKGAGHNERAWAKQVEDGLRFWLDK